MNSIITILKRIEEKPLLYLGKKDLRRLRFFIIGYLVCEKDNNRYESINENAFFRYIDSGNGSNAIA